MEQRKLTSADIDRVRDIEGFPIATDEAIIELSDAPYYTACPNPFIEDFIAENGTTYDETIDVYHREPFTSDISEGKNDAIYVAHSYHTKVPHKAIMRYILHYTDPGDIVFDGFCGTGMTGVAAQACGGSDVTLRHKLLSEMPDTKWGERRAILTDLAPAATSICRGYTQAINPVAFHNRIQSIIDECQKECGWMYKTKHVLSSNDSLIHDEYGYINTVLWSDVLICPTCGNELVYWHVALNHHEKNLSDPFKCPHCGALNKKNACNRAKEMFISNRDGQVGERAKQVPVLIVYSVGGKRFQKEPDAEDVAVIQQIESMEIPYWYPTEPTPPGYNTDQPRRSHGIERIDQFYWKRSLYLLAKIHSLLNKDELLAFTGILLRASKMNRIHINKFFNGGGGWNAGYLKGTLYVPSLPIETSVIDMLKDRASTIQKALSCNRSQKPVCISTQSLTDMRQIPSNSVDYIFVDPPFGSNINYSELNCIWEAWLKVKTNNAAEAIVNDTQNKRMGEYQELMFRAFCECRRILKPNRWITIEFHNSKNAVWAAIQEAVMRSGLIIADVRTLDKKQGSFKQVTTSSAVKQDLVISAYKPKESLTRVFVNDAGSDESAWVFVRTHLENLPITVEHNGEIEIVAERRAYLLWDRMVAYHVMHGVLVPLDATDFYRGLDERFLKRDDMYFLPEQVAEYDMARLKMDLEAVQFALLVTNEKTAIGWLYQLLASGPMTYQQIQPLFMQEVKTIDRYEAMPELSVLLEENFLQDDKGRWYVPDTKKEGDLAKLREKSLLREFDGYLKSKGKLKLFRSEAIRVGFSHLWKEKNYQAIVDLANRLPAATIQEDPNLLMYYDISLSRVG